MGLCTLALLLCGRAGVFCSPENSNPNHKGPFPTQERLLCGRRGGCPRSPVRINFWTRGLRHGNSKTHRRGRIWAAPYSSVGLSSSFSVSSGTKIPRPSTQGCHGVGGQAAVHAQGRQAGQQGSTWVPLGLVQVPQSVRSAHATGAQ